MGDPITIVDATPEGLIDASHSMGPMESDAITVPAPTPDEDGVYRVIPPLVMVHTMSYADHPGYAEVKLFLGTWSTLTPLESERLGAVLLAAAQDARRLAADNERSEA